MILSETTECYPELFSFEIKGFWFTVLLLRAGLLCPKTLFPCSSHVFSLGEFLPFYGFSPRSF
jgi:hypothetical protein